MTFWRVIKLGTVGKDVVAVKRGLARAGHGSLKGITPVFGPFAVRHLKRFQRGHSIMATGNYGRKTHKALWPHFDATAKKLYAQAKPKPKPKPKKKVYVPSGGRQLPSSFRMTHYTGGLPGYPAIDVFGYAGQKVLAPEDGYVYRISGKSPRYGGRPGGAYGYSIWMRSPTGLYFMTHFGSVTVRAGQSVKRGQVIGTICDDAVTGRTGSDHIHVGKRSF